MSQETLQDRNYQRTLVRLVRDALDDVAPSLGGSGWETKIGNAISPRLANLDARIECAYRRPVAEGWQREEREWLFDFFAGLWEPSDRNQERYLRQALIVGESEAGRDLGTDFDKLLVACSLVSFFAFPERVKDPRHPQGELEFFHEVAESRRQRKAQRGMMPPPAFIPARYSRNTGTFTYRFAADPAVLPNRPTTQAPVMP